MVEALSFLIAVGINMLDPLTLVFAAMAAFAVTSVRDPGNRWALLLGAAAFLTGAKAGLVVYVDGLSGRNRSFPWFTSATAAILQIWLLSFAIIKWRQRARG
ncbi:MAG: hypothetical protein IT481_08415 [Gammaproteobacteria bacterium]|nr:hypothetical protein [Gammaproteobacteria bacterium]